MLFARLTLGFITLTMLSARGMSAADGVDFFEAKVRPVLAEHCYSCHSAKANKARGGLELDSPEAITLGGDTGSLLKGKDGAAVFLEAISHGENAAAMPPKGKLPDKVIADLRKWVEMGTPLPRAANATPAAAPMAGPATATAGRDHWAFRPLRTHPAPAVSDASWAANAIDPFVLAALDREQLTPAPPADRRTLFRRLSFDLTGLPPTLAELDAFAADKRPDAVGRAVDALLASPRFGEKWGRHWLDVARYAEDHSTGESTCKPPPNPFRYRDWVISAVNADLPYAEFVRRQLAADHLPDLPPGDVAALGFLGLSPVYHKEPKLAADAVAAIVADEWDERVDAITRGFLGLTVSCARCHDHKFDPVSQADYTAVLGVVANTQLAERPLTADPGGKVAGQLTEVRARVANLDMRTGYAREQVGIAKKEGRDTAELQRQAREFADALKDAKAEAAKLYTGPTAPAVRDAGTAVNGGDPAWTVVDYTSGTYRDLPLFVRGNATKPGDIVPRRFLTVLSSGEPRPLRTGSGRLDLADAIVTDAAPLAARVYVNRVWGWLFGRGLVPTPSNFGLAGEPPTHPDLLDDLAAGFVANGWRTKWLVREIVTSATYRQSSRPDAADTARDPGGLWLGRAPVRRLELEQWRDAMLHVSGTLDLNGGGPSDNLDDARSRRRTVYGKVSRQSPPDIHRLFDLPDPKAHGEKREPTVTPLQQLYFLNSPFVRTAAKAVAKTVGDAAEPADAVRSLYRRVLLREPTPAEVATAVGLAGPDGWDLVAQMLLVSNEFLYLE